MPCPSLPIYRVRPRGLICPGPTRAGAVVQSVLFGLADIVRPVHRKDRPPNRLEAESFVHASFATAALRSAIRRLIASFAGRISNGPILSPGCFDISEIA